MECTSLSSSAICPPGARRRESLCHSESARRIKTSRMGRMQRFKTLIVDDESLSRRRLRRLLAFEPDCEIVGECTNGLEAMQALAQHHPDILFLDVQMPEMDGFEVVRAIAETKPLIIFTS